MPKTELDRLIEWHQAMADEPKRNQAKRAKHLETVAVLLAYAKAIGEKVTLEQMKEVMLTLRHEDRGIGNLWQQSTVGEKAVAFKVLRAFFAHHQKESHE